MLFFGSGSLATIWLYLRRTLVLFLFTPQAVPLIKHSSINSKHLRKLIRQGQVCLGGNRKLKIYGTLQCTSGKRMRKENRVFFTSTQEAIECGYRPCGNCRKDAYHRWRAR